MSKEHAIIKKREYVTVKCPWCGKCFLKYVKHLCKRNFCCKRHRMAWISKNQRGSNNPNFGNKWNAKSRKNQSRRMKRRMKDPYERWRAGCSNRGKKFSKAVCKRIAEAHKGILLNTHPHTSSSKRLIGLKSKQKWTDKFKADFRKTMEKKGFWVPLWQKTDWQIYQQKSNWVEKMFDKCTTKERQLLKKLRVFNAKTNKKGLVRDHKFSRHSGFKIGVFPKIMRHPCNFQLLTHADNAGKQHICKDSIDLETLLKRILSYKKEWKEQAECVKLIRKYRSGFRWSNPYRKEGMSNG